MNKSNRRCFVIKALLVVFILFLVVSGMDYQDEVSEHEYKCEMIKNGAWSGYEYDCN